MKNSGNKLILAVLAVSAIAMLLSHSFAAGLPSYSVSPSSRTYKSSMMNFTTYNRSTKHYYLIRSYLERLEAAGGGKLTLRKGTYTISNTLYVPSNVTIVLEDGVRVEKASSTGTSRLKASTSIFQLVSPSKSSVKGAYSGYGGERDISIVGRGNAVIDMNSAKDGISIIAGHNSNLRIENITFENMNSGHFIELDASRDVVIRGNTFRNSLPSDRNIKEAINIDTPDPETKGFSSGWSAKDRTPNLNVAIDSNSFMDLDRAIGTHKYSQDMYHANISVTGNTITRMRNDAIRVMNWRDATIRGNAISDVGKSASGGLRGILASGAVNPTFTENTFSGVSRPIQFIPWQNDPYGITYNRITDENRTMLAKNYGAGLSEYFIRISEVFGVFDYPERIFIIRR